MSNILYVYGTLRNGGKETVLVNGDLFDLGWYPGIKLGGKNTVVCERREVSDSDLLRFDVYEGYNPDDPEHSLYIRRAFLDGYIYEYNRPVEERKRVLSGDWLKSAEGRKSKND